MKLVALNYSFNFVLMRRRKVFVMVCSAEYSCRVHACSSSCSSWVTLFLFWDVFIQISGPKPLRDVYLRSNSIGINRLRSVGLVEKKNPFRLVWLINFFNRTETRFKRLKKRFNRKPLEKCSTGKPQPFQPKPVAVETVDPNRTRRSLDI